MNPGWRRRRRRRHQRSSAAGASCSAQPRPLGACCCTQPRRLGDSGVLMTSRSTKQQIWFAELRVTTWTEVKSSSTLAEGTKIELSRGSPSVLNVIGYFDNCYVYRYRYNCISRCIVKLTYLDWSKRSTIWNGGNTRE